MSCVNNEGDEGVRIVCYDALLLHIQDQDVRSLISSKSTSDASEAIRRKLKAAMQ
jgi:hypothetical protein